MYFLGRSGWNIFEELVLDDVQVQLRRKFQEVVKLFVVLKFLAHLHVVITTTAIGRVLFHDLIIEQQLSHLLYREKLGAHKHQ